MFDPYRIPGSRSLHIHRLPTWALLIGDTYSSAVHAEVRRRPHRGMLPDVDFSRAVPDPSRPSLVRRIIRLIRPGAKIRIVNSAPSGSSGAPVGEKPASPYIARSRADGGGGKRPRARPRHKKPQTIQKKPPQAKSTSWVDMHGGVLMMG
ncbi:hypothetical protein NKH19_32605, partial [Mesorhizobium sp. M1338]